MKNFTLLCLCWLVSLSCLAQRGSSTIKGRVINAQGQPVPAAHVVLEGTSFGAYTDDAGFYLLRPVPPGNYQLRVMQMEYQHATQKVQIGTHQTLELSFSLTPRTNEMSQVEVFGERDKQPEKLETITRLPLKPSDQIQSISIISDRLIQQQGALTISDATRNVPGVYTYATYGNKRESMSSRGFRGIPVLKNGVRVNSDFRGTGVLTDMEGVESMQVLKGAAAITQGVATDLGSPGGIINIVTKTPKYEQGGYASLRVGSWGQVRPSFDIYGPVNEAKTVAFRVNGAYERSDSYRRGISLEKLYVNPSLEWKPDAKTTFTVEMDYLDDSRTPDLGTVNLASNDTYAIYDLPYNQFLGFDTDRTETQNTTYAARFKRELNEQLSIRAAYYRSELDVEESSASLAVIRNQPLNLRSRSLTQSGRIDNNSVLQLDLIGQDVKTGFLSHIFQVGVDYRTVYLETPSYTSRAIDVIDVFEPISNTLDNTTPLTRGTDVTSNEKSIGLMAQDVISVTDWAKVFLGVRYTSTQSSGSATAGITRGDAWNPLAGLLVTPIKGLNLFASYTNSSNPRSASLADVNGEALGNERIDQVEAGIKSDWLNNRLRFNLTLYKINNKNMNMPVYDANWNETGYYQKGGNDERKGIEVELTGRVLENLEVIAGYALIDAKYKEHASYYYNSAPNNTPKHTANFYANYTFAGGLLNRLSIGGGAYYVGARPNNDWAKTVTHEGIVPGQKPFDVKAYTTVNLQAAYDFTEKIGLRLLANNILNEIGYNAYRTSWINQINPRNFSGVVTYRF